MRILHVVTGLNVGGAELQLCGLTEQLTTLGVDQCVVSLLPEGALSARIRNSGVDCIHLDLRSGRGDFSGLSALRNKISSFQPTVIHGWMYHACIYASLASGLLARRPPILWGIHHADLTAAQNTRSTLVASSVCRLLSYSKRTSIAYCAQSSKTLHEAHGYCRSRSTYIPNGYDTGKFTRSAGSRVRTRSQFGIPADVVAIGMVARFDAIKDHETFLRGAASAQRNSSKRLSFILFGDGIDSSNNSLTKLVARDGLEASVRLAGRWDDMVSAYSSLDFLALTSRGDAFPNVICEGMLCELPCISTDVGDCRVIVGETGFVVPPGDAVAVGQAIRDAADLPEDSRRELGAMARKSIVERFSEEIYLARCLSAYRSVAAGAALSQQL